MPKREKIAGDIVRWFTFSTLNKTSILLFDPFSLLNYLFPKGLDNIKQLKNLKKTTKLLSLKDTFRQNLYCHLQLMYEALKVEFIILT